MSTPSTATVLAVPHPYYSYPRNHLLSAHPNHNDRTYATTKVIADSAKGGNPVNMTSNSSTRARRRPHKPVDWNEFYKNGIPDEIIVIEDNTPPPPPATRRPATIARSGANGQPSINGSAADTSRHADKKRRTGNAYEPIYPGESYSQTPFQSYGSPTITATSSTAGRNSSAMVTTAPTSAGSSGAGSSLTLAHQPQNGTQNGTQNGMQNGTKRKRVTRGSLAAAAAANQDAFLSYHPPPKPPIKAKEVFVQTIADKESNKGVKIDDDDGHYIVHPDADLTQRYKITRLLGQGTFGKVVEAWDRFKNTACAIKVIRSVQKYRDASRIELRVLSTLQSNDKENRNKCIHLRDCFDYRNHICIVTDLLGMSVFDFLKSNNFAPFPNSHIQSFARQLLTSVAFLHDLNLIHTDLKPENILLVNNESELFSYSRRVPSSTTTQSRTCHNRKVLVDTEIRLIDFGSATFEDEYHSAVVSTRHYRAPEIILGLGWSFPCDIWSIGCILVEFFTGDALFQTHDNLEHLAMMERVVGTRLDTKIVKQVTRNSSSNGAAKYFRSWKLEYPNAETSRASRKYVQCMKKLEDIIPTASSFHKQFLDLLRRIFVYDPAKRITAKEALKHPWFREIVHDEGHEATALATRKGSKDAARLPAHDEEY